MKGRKTPNPAQYTYQWHETTFRVLASGTCEVKYELLAQGAPLKTTIAHFYHDDCPENDWVKEHRLKEETQKAIDQGYTVLPGMRYNLGRNLKERTSPWIPRKQ